MEHEARAARPLRAGTIRLRACYAKPGTDLGFAATPGGGRRVQHATLQVARAKSLHVRYAVSGTDVAYGPTRGVRY
eukprot:1855577-Rhodomonas_salina.1